VYILESTEQLLIQSELSYLRYLLKLAELHCWQVDPPPAHSKQSPLLGIILKKFKVYFLNLIIKELFFAL